MGYILAEKKKESARIYGQMVRHIGGSGKIIAFMVLEYTLVAEVKLLLESGLKIICMDMGNVCIMMEKNIVGFLKWIKKMDLEFYFGLKINIILDFGKTGNKMEWRSLLKEIVANMVYGMQEKKKNGLKMKKNF